MEENATNTIKRDSPVQNKEDAQQQSVGTNTKRGSIIVIAVLLALAAVGFAVTQCTQPATTQLAAKVTQNGEVVALLPLNTNTRQVFTCAEGVNTVVVQDGTVHIEDADCLGGDCMKQGTISEIGHLLVCLPHKLIVEIVAADEDANQPSQYTGAEAVGEDARTGFDVIAR